MGRLPYISTAHTYHGLVGKLCFSSIVKDLLGCLTFWQTPQLAINLQSFFPKSMVCNTYLTFIDTQMSPSVVHESEHFCFKASWQNCFPSGSVFVSFTVYYAVHQQVPLLCSVGCAATSLLIEASLRSVSCKAARSFNSVRLVLSACSWTLNQYLIRASEASNIIC